MIDGVADHGNRGHGSLPGYAKGKKRCGLHLNREYALPGPFIELRLGLAVRSIRRPHLTRAYGPSGGDLLPLEKRVHFRLSWYITVWWHDVIRSYLVYKSTRC